MLLQALSQDHQEFLDLIQRIQTLSEALSNSYSVQTLDGIDSLFSDLKSKLTKHHELEEHVLFPAMYRTGMSSQGGPRCSYFMGLHLLEPNNSAPNKNQSALECSPLGIPMEEHRKSADLTNKIFFTIQALRAGNSNAANLNSLIDRFCRLLRLHIDKEETCLFLLARQILGESMEKLDSMKAINFNK